MPAFPSPATEALSDTITLTQYLVEHPSTSSLYTIPDNSMREAGIFKGDLAVIESRPAHTGDFVVVETDGEVLLRNLWKDSKGYLIDASNPNSIPIRQSDEVHVLGVMVGLVRKL